MSDEKSACPVDHKAREAWLQHARNAQTVAPPTSDASPPPSSPSWLQTLWSYVPLVGRRQPSDTSSPFISSDSYSPSAPGLGVDRQISSIPRSSNPGPSTCPVNHEQETGTDAATGHWVYPSEKMFFEAMKRKGYEARARDMRTVVPIHNAVNERAWKEIAEWERPYILGTACGGPRLHSFAGESKRMTPKARINTLLGYAAPFDRHDWVIDRCGRTVEYVIDFYQGRDTTDGQAGPSFYLDVRPKLNSWEGVKMRVLRGLGFV